MFLKHFSSKMKRLFKRYKLIRFYHFEKKSLLFLYQGQFILRSLDEKVPKGFEILETTPLEYPANLNHGSMRWCPDMYLCYKRGQDKPPLKDVGYVFI